MASGRMSEPPKLSLMRTALMLQITAARSFLFVSQRKHSAKGNRVCYWPEGWPRAHPCVSSTDCKQGTTHECETLTPCQ